MDFCLLLKIWVEILVKSISKKVSSKYNQRRLHQAKQSATDALKTTSKRAIRTTAEAAGDLIRNKIPDIIKRVS